jgi:hypothetical protein
VNQLRPLLLALALGGCSNELGRFPSGPEPTPPAPQAQQDLLETSALATDALVQLARQVIVIPFPGGSITIGYRNGFHLIRVVMFGSERTIELQFQDAAGRPMRQYDPERTKAVRLRTTTEDRSGLRHFDLLAQGADRASDELRINGNGRVQTRGLTWLFFANNLVLAKVGNPYPLRGRIVLETPHASGGTSSVELRFNGSRIVDGTLLSGSVSVFFTLDLVTLQVTPREPDP